MLACIAVPLSCVPDRLQAFIGELVGRERARQEGAERMARSSQPVHSFMPAIAAGKRVRCVCVFWRALIALPRFG